MRQFGESVPILKLHKITLEQTNVDPRENETIDRKCSEFYGLIVEEMDQSKDVSVDITTTAGKLYR